VTTEVTLPQLGESVTEGTITEWLVDVGDEVEADQPLFELSSDKIDTEVPAPAAGVLKEIKVSVDETVDVGTVVAIIGEADEDTGGADQDAGAEESGDGGDAEAGDAEADETAEEADERDEQPAAEAEASTAEAEEPADDSGQQRDAPSGGEPSGDGDGAGQLMSPIVRRMVAEHDVDVSQISGSGEGGRITREDVEAVISGEGGEQPAAREKEAPAEKSKPERAPQPQRSTPMDQGDRERVDDLSRIRQRIAAKMMESMQNSAQLTTVQEADMTAIMRLRERHKDEFRSREGVSLSPFAFLARAAVLAVRKHEDINAHADWEAGKVKYHEYVNLGIAVDTPRGLMVPNVKGADDLTLAALARGITDVALKARGEGKAKLEMQDIEGGTFTITNTGSRGVLIDTPILNYPEVAILGTGAIQKRPVVIEDAAGPAMAIRDMVYLCLTYDHRLIDGADAARYVGEVKEIVETHDWEGEIGY
jgi:pyruvate dehydrogenase E2 component (dihydrolipoamide acetyltransferase)